MKNTIDQTLNIYSLPFNCHYDFILPIYDWLKEHFKKDNNVSVFKRKNFVRFEQQYKIKNDSQFTVVVATDEGDDYNETDEYLLEYISTYNTQTKKLIYIGFDSEIAISPKIKKISLNYFLYGYFCNIENITVPKVNLKKIKKPGGTLINRLDPGRLKTFSSFLKNNLPIYISVNDNRDRNPIDYDDFIKNHCYELFKDSDHFKNIDFDTIMANIPYRNFVEEFDKDPRYNDVFSEKYTFPTELANHSLFFLVNETYNTLYFTEKTLIPFAFKKIGLWSNPNAVDKLRNMGFDMFDDIVDHSYQYIKLDADRQDAVLNEFIKVIHNINFLDFKEINTRLDKNQKFLYENLKELFFYEQELVFDSIKKEYHSMDIKD